MDLVICDAYTNRVEPLLILCELFVVLEQRVFCRLARPVSTILVVDLLIPEKADDCNAVCLRAEDRVTRL